MALAFAPLFATVAARAAEPAGDLAAHLRDRGTGVPTSQVGAYLRPGELFVYPAFAHARDHDFEYDPNEFGFAAPGEFKGRYRERREMLVVGYGWSDRIALEFEANVKRATLEKGADDTSAFPAKIEESGLGKVKARIDWRLLEERGRRPELFSYGELVVPHDGNKHLVGTENVIVNGGLGVIRGFRAGTVTFRAGFEWDTASASPTDWQEIALEYLKRVSPSWTVYAALAVSEGDEGSAVGELQWTASRRVTLRLRSAYGLSPHGPDWAPEVGVRITAGNG
jgi:hypothetical protein